MTVARDRAPRRARAQTRASRASIADDAATRDAFARLIERLVLDRDLKARELVARTHYRTAERLRAEAVAGTGLSEYRGDDDDGSGGSEDDDEE